MRDQDILADLARQYMDVCAKPEQDERRRQWRRHNSLKPTRPLIYVRAYAWKEIPQSRCFCQDPFFRAQEDFFRRQLYVHSLGDDSIFEPWVSLSGPYKCQDWGVHVDRHYSDDPNGSYKADYPLKNLADLSQLRMPWHERDAVRAAEQAEKLHAAIGDIIAIHQDRGPFFRVWNGDLSTLLGHFRGMEHFMLDMMDSPELLHRLMGFLRDGILKVHQEAEDRGDWGLGDHYNQAMPYAEELPDPAPGTHGINRRQLWVFMAAQEMQLVSPAMHEEFLLRYQLPILSQFGLVAYGCCEDLTRKIDMLRQIPNLRRIAVSPFADVRRCAEQIGRDFVFSLRPSPTDMVGYGFDEDRVLAILRHDLNACRDCHVDITLKDVETVENDPERVRKWVALTRRVIDEVFG